MGTVEKKIQTTAFLPRIIVIRWDADARLVVVTPQKLEKGMIKKLASDCHISDGFAA